MTERERLVKELKRLLTDEWDADDWVDRSKEDLRTAISNVKEYYKND